MPYLTIARDDASVPASFPSPHGTVTAVVNDNTLNIYAKPNAHPSDWDLARALMARISDPEHWFSKTPSALSAVDYWSVSVT